MIKTIDHPITELELLDLVEQTRTMVYSKPTCDYDGSYISCARDVSRDYNRQVILKENRISFRTILSKIRPSGALNRPVWDTNGNIVPYKRIFGY